MELLSAFPIKNFHSEHTKLFLTYLPSPCHLGKVFLTSSNLLHYFQAQQKHSLSMGEMLPPPTWRKAGEHFRGDKLSPDHCCLYSSKPLHEHVAIWKWGGILNGKKVGFWFRLHDIPCDPMCCLGLWSQLLSSSVRGSCDLKEIMSSLGRSFWKSPPMAVGALMN